MNCAFWCLPLKCISKIVLYCNGKSRHLDRKSKHLQVIFSKNLTQNFSMASIPIASCHLRSYFEELGGSLPNMAVTITMDSRMYGPVGFLTSVFCFHGDITHSLSNHFTGCVILLFLSYHLCNYTGVYNEFSKIKKV